jgi:hypothetical protein
MLLALAAGTSTASLDVDALAYADHTSMGGIAISLATGATGECGIAIGVASATTAAGACRTNTSFSVYHECVSKTSVWPSYIQTRFPRR